MLSRLKISTKVASIAVAMSLVGLSASVYAANVIQSADSDYSDMIERLSKSTLSLARLNRSANALGYAAYRVLVYDGASDEAKTALTVADDQLHKMDEFYAQTEQRLTDRKEALVDIKQHIDTIKARMTTALQLGEKNDFDGAKAVLRDVDPVVVQLSGLTSTLNDETIARVDERSQALTDGATLSARLLIGGTLLGAVLGLLGAFWMSAKGITGPLNRLREGMVGLAGGKLDVEIDGQDRGDEVGSMAKAMQVFKEAANRNKRLEEEAMAAERAQSVQRDRQSAIDNAKAEDLKTFVHRVEAGFDALSAGDLTARMTQGVAPEFEPIRRKFNDSVAQLEDTIGSVVGAVGTMRVGLNQITVAAGDLSQRTEQQAASLEETVAALSDVVQGVNRTAQSADDARAATSVAQREAEKGGEVVSRAVSAMAEIEQSSEKIGRIIGVIDEIAFQTNLLALNAGVEAARAGEAGRGFAVVAQEVRGLAQRSAEAAKEIKSLISTSSAQVAQGVDLVSASGRSLEQIVMQVGGVAEVIAQMADAAREQSVSLKEVATAADQMDKVTQQNAAMVEETTAAAQSLLSETEQLAGLVDVFRAKSAGRPAAGASAPKRSAARVAPSSARPVVQMRTTGSGSAAPQASVAEDNWAEF